MKTPSSRAQKRWTEPTHIHLNYASYLEESSRNLNSIISRDSSSGWWASTSIPSIIFLEIFSKNLSGTPFCPLFWPYLPNHQSDLAQIGTVCHILNSSKSVQIYSSYRDDRQTDRHFFIADSTYWAIGRWRSQSLDPNSKCYMTEVNDPYTSYGSKNHKVSVICISPFFWLWVFRLQFDCGSEYPVG